MGGALPQPVPPSPYHPPPPPAPAGNTLPFIARYRKEATGSLDEGQLRSIVAKLAALDQLEERRSSVLGKLERLVRGAAGN